MCVDIAYLEKDITKNPNLNALLLLPDGSSFGSNKALHENSFSALAAITHYTKPENNYKDTWPDGSTSTELGPPFQFVRFLSQDFTGANTYRAYKEELV